MNRHTTQVSGLGSGPANQEATAPLETRAHTAPAGSAAQTLTVHLNIGRMTIHDMSHHDRVLMTRAMEREFTRLVEHSKDANWGALSNIPRMKAADYPAGSSPEEIGCHVANELFRTLDRQKTLIETHHRVTERRLRGD